MGSSIPLPSSPSGDASGGAQGDFVALHEEQTCCFTLPPTPPHPSMNSTKLILQTTVHPKIELKHLSTFSLEKNPNLFSRS